MKYFSQAHTGPAKGVIYDSSAWFYYLQTLDMIAFLTGYDYLINWDTQPPTDIGNTALYGRELLMFRDHSMKRKKFTNKQKNRLTKKKIRGNV